MEDDSAPPGGSEALVGAPRTDGESNPGPRRGDEQNGTDLARGGTPSAILQRNPLDIIFEAIRAADGGQDGVAVALPRVVEAAAAHGLTEGMTMEAVENWASLGVVEIGAGAVAIRPGTVSSPPVTASQPPTGAGGRETNPRLVALLSLFDGTGMARLGMDDMLRMAGSAGALVYSAFAEIDGVLATAVEAQWRARAACGMGVPHTQIARDVWDLVRGDAGPLRAALRAVPQGALLLLVAGSPCQDLTVAGRYRGRRGIAGPQSVLFYAVPVVARAISEIRPDLIVHVLLENAGTTLRQHRHAMGRALGMDEATTDGHSVVVDAADWAHLPRRRLLLSTFPRDAQPWMPPRRSAPWDRGWRPHWQAAMAPLMRARHQTGSFIRGSTFQYMAPALLYHDDGPWQSMGMVAVRSRIEQLMPPELRRAWMLLHRSPRGEDEREAERAAEWIGRFGAQHGFRPPNLCERSRVTGSAHYLESLGLGPRELYDAQGNHFDRHVIPY